MNEEDIQKLKELAANIKRINSKLVLLTLLNKAKKEYDENNLNDCYVICKKILKTNPNNPIALRGLGCVEQAQGHYEKALYYYRNALEYSENKEIEYTLIGTVYYIQEDLDNAIENYNRAIDYNDNYDAAYEGRNQSMLERHLEIADLQDSLIKQNLF